MASYFNKTTVTDLAEKKALHNTIYVLKDANVYTVRQYLSSALRKANHIHSKLKK